MSKKNSTPAPTPTPTDAGQGGAAGSGTNTLEVSGEHDPNATRKALFARYAQVSQANREADVRDTPGAAEYQAGYVDEGIADTQDGDTAGESAVQAPRTAEPAPAPAPAPTPSQTPSAVVDSATSQSTEMIELNVFGQTVFKPKPEVDAAGGVVAMQLKLAAEHRAAQAIELGRRAQEASQDRLNKDKILNEAIQKLGVSTPGSATPSAAAAPPNQAAAAPDTAAAAEKIVAGFWTGSADDARKAVTEALASLVGTGAHPASVDPAKLADLVKARVDADLAARREQDTAREALQAETNAVNELMRQPQYAAIMGNPEVKKATQELYAQAVSDPSNRGKRKVEIAAEVGARMLKIVAPVATAPTPAPAPAPTPSPQTHAQVEERTTMKRRIPGQSTASSRAPAEQQEQRFPTKPADVVEMLRAARGQTSMR